MKDKVLPLRCVGFIQRVSDYSTRFIISFKSKHIIFTNSL